MLGAAYEGIALRIFILPPEQGAVRRSRKEGGERSELIRRILIILYDTESTPRNADFISIAPKGETTHYILRVASAPSLSAVTDSLDFRVADAPLQIQFA